jgi:hypothetical protein
MDIVLRYGKRLSIFIQVFFQGMLYNALYWSFNANCIYLQQILGCNIISAMMQEYATTVKSSDVGLTWETHFKAKKQFEVQY